MGFYTETIFPRVLDLVLSSRVASRRRREVLSDAGGKVLEIGFGTGLNLAHYPSHVERITAIDDNAGMSKLSAKRIAASPIAVDNRILDAESLPLDDDSFDTVVSTWTLCSIPDVDRALQEIRRVLRPGGRFLFVEHGLSNEERIRRWQHRLTPVSKVLAVGCHLDRDIKALIDNAGLDITDLKQYYLEKTSRIAGYTYQGVAVKT